MSDTFTVPLPEPPGRGEPTKPEGAPVGGPPPQGPPREPPSGGPPPRGPTAPPPADDRPWYMRRRWQVAGGIAAFLLILFVWMSWALPIGRALEPLQSPTLVLVTADGQPFARRGSYKEPPVEADKLPKHVTDAFISIEDRRFYRHMGIDPRGIARAVRNNARDDGERAEGASTITQQLAKNAFLNNKRTLRRKVQEAIIAVYLEARLSKDEILSRYLSSIYFGDGVYGLRAAARHYFNKRPEQLSIGEAAMLAGIVKAPSRLAPTENIAAARRRARVVLAAMVDTGAITAAQARRHRTVKVREGRSTLPVGSYFADWVSPMARLAYERAYGETIVRTTLDSRLQRHAERVVRSYLNGPGRSQGATQAALVAMRTDGSVVAMVGGRDYKTSQFNRAVDARRQPGSSFKLFLYLAALRKGLTPDSTVLDRPVRIGDWQPENHESEYLNRPIPLREAFARSSNVAAARLIHHVGVNNVIRTARDLGITSPLPKDATLALGTGPVTLLELTSAYGTIAAGRAPIRPRGLLEYAPVGPTHGLNAYEQQAMLELLRGVVTHGTGKAASLSVPTFGKTGTTQDYKDAWFIGFAGDLIIGVWVGNDDNTPMRKVAGGGLPAQIWRDFAASALSSAPAAPTPLETELYPSDYDVMVDDGMTAEGFEMGEAPTEAPSPPAAPDEGDEPVLIRPPEPEGPPPPEAIPLPVPPPPGGAAQDGY